MRLIAERDDTAWGGTTGVHMVTKNLILVTMDDLTELNGY